MNFVLGPPEILFQGIFIRVTLVSMLITFVSMHITLVCMDITLVSTHITFVSYSFIHLLRLTDLPLPSRIILRAASSLFFNPVNSTLFFLDGFFEYLSFAYSTSSFNLTNWLCGTIIVGKSLDDFLWLFSQCSQQMNPSCQFHPSVLKSFLYSRWMSGFLGKRWHFNFDRKVLKHSEELQF